MLLFKQMSREILKDKIFVFLLLVLSSLTSFMFFFVRFSTDGNRKILNSLSIQNENQQLYNSALNSNIILAINFLIAFIGLTAFAYAMFYYRFYKENAKQIGFLKSIGFKNITLSSCFIVFTVILSLLGAVIGIVSGYFASDVLINANIRSYSVTGLVKAISLSSFLIGFITPAIVFCIVTFIMFHYFAVKEAGSLISGTDHKQGLSFFTRLAHSFTKILPIDNKFPVRIALRKPITILIILIAVMGFTVMFVIGYSLTLSSGEVFTSQTKGHNYLYDTTFSEYKIQSNNNSNALYYLYAPAIIKKANSKKEIQQQIIGIQNNNKVLTLENSDGLVLDIPKEDTVYIGPALREMYGFKIGEKVVLNINNKSYMVIVADIAVNAKTNAIYMDKSELSQILSLSEHTFNGVLSVKKLFDDGSVITQEQKLEDLDRASVSNQSSAIINQSIGCVLGCILIYLALLLNFQDSKRDILILHLLGYRPKKINKMLIDIYKPIIWVAFVMTLFPSIIIAQTVQRSLSIQMEDYLPFQTNVLVIIFVFILLNIVYLLVQTTFRLGIRRVICKESILNIV